MGEKRAQTEKCRKQLVWNPDGADKWAQPGPQAGLTDSSPVRALGFPDTTHKPKA